MYVKRIFHYRQNRLYQLSNVPTLANIGGKRFACPLITCYQFVHHFCYRLYSFLIEQGGSLTYFKFALFKVSFKMPRLARPLDKRIRKSSSLAPAASAAATAC